MAFVVEWLTLTFVWMLFVGKWSAPEFWAGLLGAFVATIASRSVRRSAAFRFGFRAKVVAQGWRMPGYAITGTWELLQALYEQLFTKRGAESLLRAAKFRSGGDDAPSRTRRALAVAYTCGTPNFVILGIDRKNRLLLFHQVKRGEVLTMTKNLGAEGEAA